MRRENRAGKKTRGRARSSRGVYDDEEEEPFRHGRLGGGLFNGVKNDPPPLCSLSLSLSLSPRPVIEPFNCVRLCILRLYPLSSPRLTALAFSAPLSFSVYLTLASFIFLHSVTFGAIRTSKCFHRQASLHYQLHNGCLLSRKL